MKYFQNIVSLADLKKQYRALALTNHPDRGGSTLIMQEINLQFGKLYPLWENTQSLSQTVTGYEDDHAGASAKEYAKYVYNEYRWRGKNYKGQSNYEIIDIFRNWIKETYPRYRFSVRRDGYDSFYIHLIHADFVAFTPQAGDVVYMQINHYSIMSDDRLTDRAKEVMQNVYEFVKSYHYDDSDSMTDYFNTNFYLHLSIGDDRHPYKIVVPKLKGGKSDAAAQFKHPEEIGCQGSSQADMSFFDDCRYVVQCDRKGAGDMVTHYSGTELCSDDFLLDASPDKFGYSQSDGLITDVITLKNKGLKVSCVNLSCGYYLPHTPHEFTCVEDLTKCYRFVQHIIKNCNKTYHHQIDDISMSFNLASPAMSPSIPHLMHFN